MHRSWIEKNVDLALLITCIGDFFKENDFDAIKGTIPTGYQIFAENSSYFKINGYVSVSVEGTPQNFTVNFELCTDKKKHYFPHSMFLESMIFGGYFILRRLKSEDAWVTLEKEFWRHVENAVLQLSNSAKDSG